MTLARAALTSVGALHVALPIIAPDITTPPHAVGIALMGLATLYVAAHGVKDTPSRLVAGVLGISYAASAAMELTNRLAWNIPGGDTAGLHLFLAALDVAAVAAIADAWG